MKHTFTYSALFCDTEERAHMYCICWTIFPDLKYVNKRCARELMKIQILYYQR